VSDRGRSLIVYAIAMAAVGVALAWAAYLAREALLLIYVSVLLAIGFGPLVWAIERQRVVPIGGRLPRWLAILIIYLVIVGVLILAGALVVPPLVTQAQDLWRHLPQYFDQAQTWLVAHGLLNRRISMTEAVQQAPGSPGDAVSVVASAVGNVASAVFGAITVLILTFYMLVESQSLFLGLARLFPRDRRTRVVDASREISQKVSAWLTGQLILAGAIGSSTAIALYLLGVPYFYVLALISAIGEMIPVVGPIFSAVPAILAGFTVSPHTALWVLIFFVLQQQAENHLLVPNIMERQVGVNAVVVIVALLIGGSLLGIIGAVLAVPTAAIVQVVISQILDERDRQAE
jgi:predicted PurR-regulated permease PerM